MSQLWMKAAAESLRLPLTTWSGGTESTAMNPRAVASLRRAGFEITQTTKNNNPIYHVSMGTDTPTQTCFSKPWSSPPNPTRDFFAVMVCNDADQKCPTVPGRPTASRFRLWIRRSPMARKPSGNLRRKMRADRAGIPLGGPQDQRAFEPLRRTSVKSTEVHHVVPSGHKITHEQVGPIVRGIHLADGTQLGIGPKDQVHRRTGPAHRVGPVRAS